MNYVRSLGSAVSTSSGTTLTITLVNAVPAGDTIIVRLSTEYESGSSSLPKVEDTRLNSYSRVRTSGSLGFALGPPKLGLRNSTFRCYLTTALQVGDVLTITTQTAVTTKVATADHFTNLQNSVDTPTNGYSGTGRGFGSGAVTGTSFSNVSANAVVINALYARGPVGDAHEISPGYGELTRAGSSGSSINEATVMGGWKDVFAVAGQNFQLKLPLIRSGATAVTTSGSSTIAVTGGAFTSADIGRGFETSTGGGSPVYAEYVILSVTDSTHIVVDRNASSSTTYPLWFVGRNFQLHQLSIPVVTAPAEPTRSFSQVLSAFGANSYYKMEEASGSFADTVRGSGYAATPHGTVTHRSGTSPVADLRAGAAFNGDIGNWIEIANDALFSVATSGELTVVAWMRPDVLDFDNVEGADALPGEGRYLHWMGKAAPPGEGSPTTLFSEDGSGYGTGATITDESYYDYASFPDAGTSLGTNPSTKWEMDTGNLYEASGWIYSGRPIDYGAAEFFRLNTRDDSFDEVDITWDYKSAAFGTDGYTPDPAEAVDLWLRYQSQFNLYILQFDRQDNRIYVKRKIPYDDTGGPKAASIANDGIYYVIPTDDTAQPRPNQLYATWSAAGLGNLAHNSSTVYSFRATIDTLPDDTVQIRFWRGSTLVGSWIDDGRSGLDEDDSRTQGDDIDDGYFTSITGYGTVWDTDPIASAGKTGFRADNIKVWFDNVVVQTLTANIYQYEWMGRIYNKHTGDGSGGFTGTLTARPNRTSVYHFNTSGGLGSGSYFEDALTAGQWMMVVASFNLTGPSIYKNGVWRDSDFFSDYGITPTATGTPVRFGTVVKQSWFEGAVGPVAFFDRKLSDEEIYRLYLSRLNGTPPDETGPTVTISSPASGATVAGTISVTGSASDPSGVSLVELRVDSGSYLPASGTTSWSYSLDTTTLTNASHSVTARATDLFGNQSTASVTFDVDNVIPPPPDTTPPDVAWTLPDPDDILSGTITLSGTSSDDVDVALVQWSIDGGAFTSATGTTSWSDSLDTTLYADGGHTLLARATDTSGNYAEASLSVLFDNTPEPPPSTAPEITLDSPLEGDTLSGDIVISGTAVADAGISLVEVAFDGEAYHTATGTSSWTYPQDTTDLDDGPHWISARVTDDDDAIAVQTISVTVDNTAPAPIPIERDFTDKERDFIDNSPPDLWPENQDSVFGQLRRVITDALQETVDQMQTIWLNMVPQTADFYLAQWEQELALPVDPDLDLASRRARVSGRLHWGMFTRPKRQAIVEAHIIATFGPPLDFTPEGIILTVGGVALYSGEYDLAGTYNIVEDIEDFSYEVRILDTITPDEDSLTRELARITPAGISFTIVYTATP